MDAVTRGTEAIGRELDSVLDIIGRAGTTQQEVSTRPPASKKVDGGPSVLEGALAVTQAPLHYDAAESYVQVRPITLSS